MFKSTTIDQKNVSVAFLIFYCTKSKQRSATKLLICFTRDVEKPKSFVVYVSPRGVIIAKCEMKMDTKQFLLDVHIFLQITHVQRLFRTVLKSLWI